MNELMKDIERILLSEDEIDAICKDIGSKISNDYKGKNPLVIGFLKGCVPFYAELIKRITVPCQIDFIAASSYSKSESTEIVNIKKDVEVDVSGRDVLLVDDIIETGLTLKKVIEMLQKRNPNSIKIVALLDKPSNRKVSLDADYVGIKTPNEFIVGFGLDYDEKYRNLPFIGVLKREVYTN